MPLLNKNHIYSKVAYWAAAGRYFLQVLQSCNLSIILFSSYAKSEINDQEVYLVQIEAESGEGKK